MKFIELLVILLLINSKNVFGQLKSFDKKKYSDCIANIDIDFKKPNKYFEESKKYENLELLIVYTDYRNKIIATERGFIKNSEINGKRKIWMESKMSNDSTRIKYTNSLAGWNKNTIYFAECFDRK